MDLIIAILAFSTLIWYLVDRFKPFWEGHEWSKYVTTSAAALLGALCVFSFGLDIVFALGLVSALSIQGQIITVLALMTGSGAVSDIVEKIKN